MLSKYNIYYEADTSMIIYNNYTKKVISLSKMDYDDIKMGKKIDSGLLKKLYKYGMIYDENQMSESTFVISDYMDKVKNTELEITIMASTTCNFKCKYCYEDYKPQTINENFVKAFLEFVEKNIDEYKGIYIDWFGGEPLLASEQIVEISNSVRDICRNKHKPYISSITTNGYFLNKDLFKKLLGGNIRYYQITIDGNKKWHNHYRPLKNGEGTYDVIMNNLLEIKEQAKNLQSFTITLRNNVCAENYDACVEFMSYFEKNFGDDNRFKLFQFPIKNWGGERIKEIKQNLIEEEKVDILYSSYNRTAIFESIVSQACVANKKNGYVITPDLLVFKCSHHIIDNDDMFEKNQVGYLSEDGVLRLDERKNRYWYGLKLDAQCKECNLLPNCIVACPIYEIKPYKGCVQQQYDKIYQKVKVYANSKKEE